LLALRGSIGASRNSISVLGLLGSVSFSLVLTRPARLAQLGRSAAQLGLLGLLSRLARLLIMILESKCVTYRLIALVSFKKNSFGKWYLYKAVSFVIDILFVFELLQGHDLLASCCIMAEIYRS
jgi:hypothetical protein